MDYSRHEDARDSRVPGERRPNLDHLNSRICANTPGNKDRDTCSAAPPSQHGSCQAPMIQVRQRTGEDASDVHDRGKDFLAALILNLRDALRLRCELNAELGSLVQGGCTQSWSTSWPIDSRSEA